MHGMLQTERLILRHFTLADAPFIIALLNSEGWLRYIGNRNIHTQEDAKNYLRNVPLKSYTDNGFGLYAVTLKDEGTVIGSCGLIRRDTLPHVDIGFAYLPEYARMGYGYEAAQIVLQQAKDLGLDTVLAITDSDNILLKNYWKNWGCAIKKTLPCRVAPPHCGYIPRQGNVRF